jgi:hypothetical protein
MRFILAALLIVCVAATFRPCAAAAQIAAGPDSLSVHRGARVRVKALGLEGIFVVENLQPGVLWLRDPDGVMPQKVRVADLSSLEIDISNPAGRSALHGAVFGAGAGFMAGIVVGLASGDDPPGEWGTRAEGKAMFLGVVGAAAGLLIGASIGTIHPGETWQPVPLNGRLDTGMTRDGTVRVGFAFSVAGRAGE